MTTPLTDKQIDQLIADYLTGSLREADRPAFEDWLRVSPDHPRRVARLSATDYAMREVCQDTKADYLLDVLNQIDDASGPAELVTLHAIDSSRQNYRLLTMIGGAIAAVLLIAVTLIITLQGPSPEPSTIANTPTPNKPAASTESRPRGSAVATLTAEHNAVWSGGPASVGLATGAKLHPGDRLFLTAGFAEITTNDGAIAILEAPAAIELLDNDNALRLHTGKLVGICETESSKGFLVRTPQMDITDLGTRFGVHVDAKAGSAVHVFEGKVFTRQVDSTSSAVPINLDAGEGASVSADTGLVKQFVSDARQFAGFFGSDSASVLRYSNHVRFLNLPPASLDTHVLEDSEHVVLLREQTRLVLTNDLSVVSGFKTNTPEQSLVLNAGSTVDSYLIHFDPVGAESGSDKVVRISGEVVFTRRVVGLITDGDLLNGTDGSLGLPQVQYPGNAPRGLESTTGAGVIEFDSIDISEDGLVLSFELRASGGIDQVRVLIEAEERS